MGGKSTKITYQTVDKTDPQAQERGRQAAMQENARLVQEMEQRLQQQKQADMAAALQQVHQQNERDATRAAENRRRAAELEAKRRQEEQLRLEKLAILKMKNALLAYEFGNKVTMATFHNDGLDVTDMKRVRIALFGPTGSGKTSFIGTLERSLLGRDKQTAFEQGAGAEGTVVLEEYLSQLRFNLVDTRGFWNIDDSTADECLKIMTGRINIGSEIQRDYDMEEDEQMEIQHPNMRACAKFSDRVHAVIFVVRANDTRLKDKTYLTRMKKIRDHFRFEGHSPVTVITCEDKLKNKQDREIAFNEASAATGSPQDRTYFITNYTHEHTTESLPTEKSALNIIDTVLLSAERFVKIQKLREEHHGIGGAGTGQVAGGGETVKHLFNRLQVEHDLDQGRVSRAMEVLMGHQINTVEALKGCWEDVKGELQMTVGMRSVVTKALKRA